MLWTIPAFLLLAASGHLVFSALDRPLRPIPAGVDPVYLIVPALLLGFCGIVSVAFVFGASWQDVGDAIGDVITNMFAIV